MTDTWYVCKCGADREQADDLTTCAICGRMGMWTEERGTVAYDQHNDFDIWYDRKCEEARDE